MSGHGPSGRYFGRYDGAALEQWAAHLAAFDGDAYVYFDNDIKSAAPFDAERLIGLLAASP